MGVGVLPPQLARLGVVSIALLAAPPALGMQPCPDDSPAAVAAAIAELDAPLDPTDPDAYTRRIHRIQDRTLWCDGPNPAPALFRLFLRSRYGVPDARGTLTPLPEDPDLFEGALLALSRLPPEQVADGAAEGLGTGLVDLTWSKLRHDWLTPAAQGLSAAEQRWVADWQPPPALPTAVAPLVALVEQHPQAAVFALTTGGGSLAQEVVLPLQDNLLATFLAESASRPAVVRAVAGAVVDGQLGGPALSEALSRLPSPDPQTEAAIDRARAHLGSPPAWPPVRLPAVAPGRMPGLEAGSGEGLDPADFTSTASPSMLAGSGWLRLLLGGVGALGAIWVGARPRRRLAAPVFGLGLVVAVDGVLDLLQLAPATPPHPLFQFIARSTVALHPHPQHAGRVWLGGGSMRHTVLDRAPSVEVPRVAFLGASSMHGSHYVRAQTLPEQVRAHGVLIEPLHLGIGGTTSAGVASAGRAALELGSDALVVLYGHNEVAQFSRLALYRHTSAAQLRARLWLGRSATYRLLSGAMRQPPRAHAASTDLYRSTPPTRAEIRDLTGLAVDHLRQQLGSLLTQAADAGVPVVLVVPPTNLRFAHLQPFDTPGPGDAADLRALREDAEAAAQAGDAARARALLQAAIDRSASPRELVTPIREALVDLGTRHGATVLDGQAWMCAHAPDGVTPSGFFWDDVHPTAEGHRALARLVAPALERSLETAAP